MTPERLDSDSIGSSDGFPHSNLRSKPMWWSPFLCGALAACGLCVLLSLAFVCGRWTAASGNGLAGLPTSGLGLASSGMPAELLRATSTHGTTTMAVCTAKMDEEQDGFFSLDYLTGDLKGWVYYPRTGTFGGLFATNVAEYLGPPGKNPEYLLIAGDIIPPPAGANIKPAASIVYVVDVRMGNFVAFTVPWSKALKNAGAVQAEPFVPVGGDVIRPAIGPGAARKPPAVKANQNQADPNDPPDNKK